MLCQVIYRAAPMILLTTSQPLLKAWSSYGSVLTRETFHDVLLRYESPLLLISFVLFKTGLTRGRARWTQGPIIKFSCPGHFEFSMPPVVYSGSWVAWKI